MDVKKCACLLLGVAVIACVVDASSKEVTTPKTTPVVIKKVAKKSYRGSSQISTRYGQVERVETSPYIQPMMPDEVKPFPLLPQELPPPMLPDNRPRCPGRCPRGG